MKKYAAEFIGTFCLILFGCGAAVIAGNNIPGAVLNAPPTAIGLGLLGISLAFGLSVVVMAYAIGPVSGCHINPAITISMLVAGKMNVKDATGYLIAQFAGATLGAAILYIFQKDQAGFAGLGEFALGSNGYGAGYLGQYGVGAAFAAEFIMSFLFLLVIFGVTSKRGNSSMAGLAIGLTLVLIHMVTIPITGTSVNPARSFGPAVFAGGKALQQLWLFLVAPVAGGIAAALVRKAFFED